MRTIKFRGKSVETGEWVYGSLINNVFFKTGTREAVTYIVDPSQYPDYDSFEDMEHLAVEVIPKTVGQLSGNTDKFGKNDIYEDDIIEIEYYPDLLTTKDLDELIVRTVCRYGADCAFHLSGIGKSARMTYSINFGGSAVKRKEVIGNIHENPDLLEVKA